MRKTDRNNKVKKNQHHHIDKTLSLLGLIGMETKGDVELRKTVEDDGLTRVEHPKLTWAMIENN